MADFMLLLIIFPAISCQDTFYVSPEMSTWSSSSDECIPATPNVDAAISFSPSEYNVSNPGIDLPYNEDVWVGYYQVVRVFEYIGCVEHRYFFPIEPQFVTIKGDPGHCFPSCGESTVVGVTKTRCYCLGDVFNHTRIKESGCTDKCNNPIVVCGQDKTPVKYTYISIYKINSKVPASYIQVSSATSGKKDCLHLDASVPIRFYWNVCSISLKAMCFYEGLVVNVHCITGSEYCTWIDAANTCFHKGRSPMGYSNSKDVVSGYPLQLWTGLFKTNVVYKHNANIPEERRHDAKQFGYLTKESETSVKLKFTGNDSMKKFLCMQERSKENTQTTQVTKSVSSSVDTTELSSFSTTKLPNTSDTGFNVTVSVPIAVSSVVVVVIVLCVAIVVLTKRRRKYRGAHQTRVEYVPEQTNNITPTSDEPGDRAYATVQDNDTSGVNDGYENPNPQRNVYEALRESRVEEHGYGTSGQAAGGFYQSLEGERMDVHNYEVADQPRELPYDSLEDTTKDTRNYETSNQTTNAAAYEWVK